MKRKVAVIIIILVSAILTASTFVVQYITGTGVFFVPGVVVLDDNIPAEKVNFLNDLLYTDETLNAALDSDVVISFSRSVNAPQGEDDLLYQVLVPVTDFYSTATSITQAEALECAETACSSLLPFAMLHNQTKLLAIDADYYLDDPSAGAVFEYFTVSEEASEVAKIKALITSGLSSFPQSADEFLTFIQTGVTALSRKMNTKLQSVGSATFFSEKISTFLKSFDLVHTSNESSFSSYASGTNICSDPKFKDTLLDIGLNIVELTGNHNQDCGDQAAKDSIDFYNQNNIKIVGGGKTAAEAATPLEINQKNTGITMLAYNLSTGGYTLDDTPGANFYNEDDLKANITQAKERGDTIIVDIQFYECAAYDRSTWTATCIKANSTASDPQYGSESQFFRHLIDLGADIVVGTAAHQAQTYELYSDGVIYYGLGNLFFDQASWPNTTRSLMLGHYFYNGRLLQTRLYGTIYGSDFQTRLMNNEEFLWFINQLNAAR